MTAVAEGGVFCFAATTGPDRSVFLYRNHFRSFARPFGGAVAVGWVLDLGAAAESEGLTGFRIDLVGRGLPAYCLIFEKSRCVESAN